MQSDHGRLASKRTIFHWNVCFESDLALSYKVTHWKTGTLPKSPFAYNCVYTKETAMIIECGSVDNLQKMRVDAAREQFVALEETYERKRARDDGMKRKEEQKKKKSPRRLDEEEGRAEEEKEPETMG